MNFYKLALLILGLAAMAPGCGRNMTIVKTHPKVLPKSSGSAEKVTPLELGIGQYNRHQLDSAETSFENAIAQNYKDWGANYYRGRVYFDKGDYVSAIARFTESLKYSHSDPEIRANIYFQTGLAWEKMNVLSKAEQNFITACNLNPALDDASEGLVRVAERRAEKD